MSRIVEACKTTPFNQCFAYHVWVADRPEFRKTINARTAGKAKAEFLNDLLDAGWDYRFTDLRVRCVGRCHTPEGFQRTAAYRGMPTLKCGQRVIVGRSHGIIVGHNASANFDVLFDDDAPRFAGQKLNVHPSDITLEDEV